MSDAEPIAEQAVVQSTVPPTARIDWRKLLIPSLLVMVLPTGLAFFADKWLGAFPIITIAAIIICFPLATFFVVRIALQEMDRVIDELAPPPLELENLPGDEALLAVEHNAEVETAEVDSDVAHVAEKDAAAEDNAVKP